MSPRHLHPEGGYLAPDETVDLDNCAREPIHIPGSVQPRGVLLGVRESDGVLVQVSANVADRLGVCVDDALGAPLARVLGERWAHRLREHARRKLDLALHNPVHLDVTEAPAGMPEPRSLDAVLHRPPLPDGADPLVVVELEPAHDEDPGSHPVTLQAVRAALAELDAAPSLSDLFDVTARRVRELTGFDRAMVYRFDADYNGEVVAEAKREDLNSFYGLHYPATDIPAQARALYEKNWVRLIADSGYTAVPIRPTIVPGTDEPLDLTYSTLRSVSPIHLEYLANMGVTASMSISLLDRGRLWGLIACHHYSGPHEPAYAVRVAAELLGSSLSVRLVAQAEDERVETLSRDAALLADLVAASRDDDGVLGARLTRGDALARLVHADGVVLLGDESRFDAAPTDAGLAPPSDAAADALRRWLRSDAVALSAEATDGVVATENLGRSAPEVAALMPDVAGLMAALLPEGRTIVWYRGEVLRSVDWGGDPRNKEIARLEDGTVRLSPRKSFERWSEVVRGFSEPWTPEQRAHATSLRSHVVESLYHERRREIVATQTLQRSLLPVAQPELPGWHVESLYDASGAGLVGGDWYDALVLPDGALAVAVGDVTGHGMPAAATMAQLRHALRSALVNSTDVAESVRRLARLMRWTMPGEIATCLVASIDPGTGDAWWTNAGHPPALVVGPDGSTRWLERADHPPLGLLTPDAVRVRHTRIEPGETLVLYTDGLVERTDESVLDGLARLAAAWAAEPGAPATRVVTRVRDPRSADDATLVLVRRAA